MDDQVCPRCKTTKYRNPSLKLLVNVCGHTLCESCVDLLFLKGLRVCWCLRFCIHVNLSSMSYSGAGSCPECNVPLRRSNFRVQLFEEPKVEKEIDIRRRILRDYNKKVSCRCFCERHAGNNDFRLEEPFELEEISSLAMWKVWHFPWFFD